uniref:Uncharacterized protein n=1 Tax=Steinernema glaseri TaxID=37863 RepID=A0A1I7ZUB4_9BILA
MQVAPEDEQHHRTPRMAPGRTIFKEDKRKVVEAPARSTLNTTNIFASCLWPSTETVVAALTPLIRGHRSQSLCLDIAHCTFTSDCSSREPKSASLEFSCSTCLFCSCSKRQMSFVKTYSTVRLQTFLHVCK